MPAREASCSGRVVTVCSQPVDGNSYAVGSGPSATNRRNVVFDIRERAGVPIGRSLDLVSRIDFGCGLALFRRDLTAAL